MKKNIVKNPMTSSYISKSNVKIDVKQSKPKHYSQIKDDFGGNFQLYLQNRQERINLSCLFITN